MIHHRRVGELSVDKRPKPPESAPEQSDHDHTHVKIGVCSLPRSNCFGPFLASCNCFFPAGQPRRRPFRILLPSIISILLVYAHYPATPPKHSVSYLEPMQPEAPDYGGLEIVSLRDAPQFSRQISLDKDLAFEKHRGKLRMEASDDTGVNDKKVTNQNCRQPDWASRFFPNCNNMHENDFSGDLQAEANVYSYLIDCGQYRDAWVLNSTASRDRFVIKSLRMKHDLNIESIQGILPDAIVMERLTSSPRIVNMYGLCGTSVAVQYMPYTVENSVIPNDKAKNETLGVCQLGLGPPEPEVPMDIALEMPNEPRNNISSTKKLEMAFEMAASIADLHGFYGGVIVHRDIQLRQWLRQSPDGKLILGDFNLAHVLSWNNKKGKYCKFERGRGLGNYRAPEEIQGAGHLSEKLDVFSFCNTIYSLLTGQRVILDYYADAAWQERKMANYADFVRRVYRHRSYAEEKLVNLLERCWEPDTSKRIDIFKVVQFLRDAMVDNGSRKRSSPNEVSHRSRRRRKQRSE